MTIKNQQGFSPITVMVLLGMAIVIGVILVQTRTNILPQASEGDTELTVVQPTETPPVIPVASISTPSKISKNDQFITFTWNSGSELTGEERVNLYEVGVKDSASAVSSVFLTCTGQPGKVEKSGSCKIQNQIKDSTKTYEFRLFAQDGLTLISKSNPIELN